MGPNMGIGDLLIKVQDDIKRVGWSAVGVFAAEGDEPSWPFCYTIGFREHDHPEMIVVGLDTDLSHPILHGLYERVAAGERFETGQRDAKVLEGYDVEFREMPVDGRPLNMARAYYGVDELPALQVLWPDQNGFFPGQEECDPLCAERQELIEEDDDE